MPRTALNRIELSADAPTRVELIPAGPHVVGRDGRNWLFDAISAENVLAAFLHDEVALPIDINHSTEHKAPGGDESPAMGWIQSLAVEGGALVGQVEWTPRGQDLIASRAYRYLSPVFAFSATDGRIARLVSAALTNSPNLRLGALNSQEDRMNRSALLTAAIAAALSLSADATDDQIALGLNSLKASADKEKALNSQQPSLDKYVPRADYDTLQTRATNAEQKLKERDGATHTAAVDVAINAALHAGKITPATEDYHRANCASADGLAQFTKYADAAPVIGAPTDLGKRKLDPTNTALNAEERAVCVATGVSEKDFIAARAV